MIALIILIAITAVGIALTYSYKWEILGAIMSIIGGTLLFFHIVYISFVSYEYEIFVVKRDAFEATLNNARNNGNEYETAAIVKEIAEFNKELAASKYQNKTLFLDQYIDDRIESLEPIK